VHLTVSYTSTVDVERLLRAQPVSVANHVKACQSLIDPSELCEILLLSH